MKKLVPPILFLICLALMILVRYLWPVKVIFPFPYNLLGVLPVGLGLCLGFLGMLKFRKVKTNIRPFKEADKLVTDGPFHYTRNPMYLGIATVLVGACLLMGAVSPLLGVLIFVGVADRWYIRFEERMLQQKFGAAFDAYRSTTRRWL
jgi:protein-S-isoprenylcysteine O-methyltransferase Ste14